MATVKQIAGQTIDVEVDDITETENDLDNDLSSIFAEFGGAPDDKAYKIKVYRVIADRGEMAWLFDCVPSELPINARLRDEHHGGRFEMRIYELKGGRFTLKKKPHVVIEAPIKKTESQSSDLAAVVKALADQNQRNFEQLRETMQQANNSGALPSNPIALMKELAEAMKAIMPAPQSSGLGGLKEAVETLGLLKELIPDRSGAGETNIYDLAKSLLESPVTGAVLQTAIAAKQGQPQMKVINPDPAQAAPAVTPSPQPIAGNPNLSEQQKMELAKIAEKINWLCDRAAVNGNLSAAAIMLEEDLGTEFFKSLADPAAIDRAAMLVPRVNQYRGWFGELQSVIIDMLKEDEAPPAA